jgi:hypothetical protein
MSYWHELGAGLSLIAFIAVGAPAQVTPVIADGNDIRVHFEPTQPPGRPLRGTVATVTADTLQLLVGRTQTLYSLPASQIWGLEVHSPSDGSGATARGALVGAAVLGGIAALAAVVVLDGGDEGLGAGTRAITYGIPPAIVGAVLGAVVGVSGTGQWVAARLPERNP